jgi:hypothetical protein
MDELLRRPWIAVVVILVGLWVTWCYAAPHKKAAPRPLTMAEKIGPRPKDDPLQMAAWDAITGRWGPLPRWKQDAYWKVWRECRTVQGKAWVTSYYTSEGFPRGSGTRSGRGVSERSAAIRSADWGKYKLDYIWCRAYGMRQIEDTGANSNQAHARHKGADRWVDYWFPENHPANPVCEYAIIPRGR